jgi:hypothetical protein
MMLDEYTDWSELQPDTTNELRDRLPEIWFVSGKPRDELVRLFKEDVPGYFWVARASEEYHPPDERGVGGLFLHTKRVFVAYSILERSFRAMSTFDQMEANCARAAVLLHDAFKYSRPPHDLDELPEHTEPEHDVWMAEHVRNTTEMPEQVADCIEAHGGSKSWYSHSGPTPRNDLELSVHLADLIASWSGHQLPVYEPHDALEDVVGPLNTVGDDWAGEL